MKHIAAALAGVIAVVAAAPACAAQDCPHRTNGRARLHRRARRCGEDRGAARRRHPGGDDLAIRQHCRSADHGVPGFVRTGPAGGRPPHQLSAEDRVGEIVSIAARQGARRGIRNRPGSRPGADRQDRARRQGCRHDRDRTVQVRYSSSSAARRRAARRRKSSIPNYTHPCSSSWSPRISRTRTARPSARNTTASIRAETGRNCGSGSCVQDREALKQDDFSSNRHPALAHCLSMIFSENRCPLFGIML